MSKEIPVLKPLVGHTTPETAYVVNDYPYGFRLRCKIRYWLEYKAGFGFRLMSQTTNPKVSYERWNKPKGSTYTTLAIMGLDGEDHVTWTGAYYIEREEFTKFLEVYQDFFDDTQKQVAENIEKALLRYEAKKAANAAKATLDSKE